MSSLARRLVLDEIFDVSLYRALRGVAQGPQRDILDALIVVETQHVAYWQRFFALEKLNRLDLGRRLKLRVLEAVCRLFGAGAIQVVLEAIEVHGVRKYLRVWKQFRDHPLGGAVRGILEDEFKHEDMLVTGAAERRINPDTVRNVFLGLNDGLVEILGAVSGFFAAFGNPIAVLAAGLTVAVAGALSMAAGAYVATSSEAEVRATEEERRRFLGEAVADGASNPDTVRNVFLGLNDGLVEILGAVSGFFAAFGNPIAVLAAGLVIVVVSAIVAFLSGMDVRRRIALNVAITGIAVAVTYGIGLAAKAALGVSV
jgi:VIT1/CCC1 family predicted Fe2+/Mn2+ transporter